MIHEIAPEYIDNQYKADALPQDDSRICIIKDRKLLLHMEEQQVSWPTYGEFKDSVEELIYLFEVSSKTYYLANIYTGEDAPEGYEWYLWQGIRDLEPKHEAFAVMTAYHLYLWYSTSRFCGKCGAKMMHSDKERMMQCPECKNMSFPVIAPAVIVGVIDKENNKILVTNYSSNASHSLVAGFVEIGENLDDCCKREVFEETGIRIKNVQYYDSQPWGYGKNLMIGFTAELDGSNEITIDENEIAAAAWRSPEELPDVPELSSLTRTMIHRFKNGIL